MTEVCFRFGRKGISVKCVFCVYCNQSKTIWQFSSTALRLNNAEISLCVWKALDGNAPKPLKREGEEGGKGGEGGSSFNPRRSNPELSLQDTDAKLDDVVPGRRWPTRAGKLNSPQQRKRFVLSPFSSYLQHLILPFHHLSAKNAGMETI